VEEVENPTKSPTLNVVVSASFPAAEIFGIKLVNGKQTQAVISFTNNEPEPVVVAFVGGSLWTPDFDPQGSRIVRNLSTVQYGVQIPAGEKETVPYSFVTDMHPQELRLNLAAVVGDQENSFYTFQAFNGTVSVVEPNTSVFDPQIIFLYLFLLGLFGTVIYFFYNIWVAPYFAPKRRGGERTKRPAAKKVDEAVPVGGADGPAVSTGAKPYNEEWIPQHHMQRPDAKRVKSGGPRPKSRGKAE